MAKTSVHLKPCNIAVSETHNKREKELDYVKSELSHLNESFSYTDLPLQAELAKIKREVKQKTGRKLQKNAIPLKEGVIVIGEHTTMTDIRKYCDICRERFGIQPLQIHIHRDEGHANMKEWKPNLHAHIVWSMYNEEGRNVRLSSEDCSEMQTILADTLGMERGKQSNKKHLSSLQFKIQEQERRISELETELKGKTELEEKLIGILQGTKEGVSDLFTGKARRKAREAEKRAQEALEHEKEAKIKHETEIANIKSKADKLVSDAERKAREAIEEKESFISTHKREIDSSSIMKEKLQKLTMQSYIKDRQIESLTENNERLNKLFDVAEQQHLTPTQVRELRDGREVEVESVYTEDGMQINTPGARLKYVQHLLISVGVTLLADFNAWIKKMQKKLEQQHKNKEIATKNLNQMEIASQGWREDMIAKATPAIKQIAHAIKQDLDPENYTIPLISVIRRMQDDGADAGRIKALLTDVSEDVCFKITNDAWDTLQDKVNRIIFKNVYYQLSLGNGRGLKI